MAVKEAGERAHPCPCCGEEDPAWVETDYDQFQYVCNCGLSTPTAPTKNEAMDWWIYLADIKRIAIK
jgi:hypothetical protein